MCLCTKFEVIWTYENRVMGKRSWTFFYYSRLSLRRTPSGPKLVSVVQRRPSWLSSVPKIWTPVIEECLAYRREPPNAEDKNTIAVVKNGFVVGHVPKCFSLWMSMFL